MNSRKLFPNSRSLRFLAKRLTILLVPALLIAGIVTARAECILVGGRVLCN